MRSSAEIIDQLGLKPHPEGGFYRQTFADPAIDGTRPASTAIYYLLAAGQLSHWHRVDAAEVWHYYAGAPLRLRLSPAGTGMTSHTLGADLGAGELPQIVVPTGWWQSAETLGDWTLVGCTVAPGFRFEGFEMAAPDWTPSPG